MTPILAIKLTLQEDVTVFLLTWGEVPGYVDRSSVEKAAWDYVSTHGTLARRTIGVHVCRNVGEAADAPYFYESFFEMTSTRQPRTRWGRMVWNRIMARGIANGRQFWLLGIPVDGR